MVLLVASLLLAALAPVMTKKINENLTITGVGNSLLPKTFCGYVNDTIQDQLNSGNKACKVPQNTYSMNAIIVSGGGGGAGALGKVTEQEANTFGGEVLGGTNALSEGGYFAAKNFTIDRYMTDIWVELLTGGGGGGYGSTNRGGRPASQSDCGNWGVYVSPEQNGESRAEFANGTCVSRQNPGEALVSGNGSGASPNIDTLVSQGKIKKCTTNGDGSSCTESGCGGLCCWVGTTTGSSCKNKSGYTYSGCNRTACQWAAARTVCAAWKPVSTAPDNGRLPSGYEFNSWKLFIDQSSSGASAGPLNKGASGLQLCNGYDLDVNNNNLDAPYCAMGAKCNGSRPNKCFLHAVWTSSHPGGSGSHWHYDLGKNGTIYWLTEGYSDNDAFSVRCVLDRISPFNGYTGGGGGGGRYAKVKIPDDVLKKAFKKDDGTLADTITLRLLGGYGGKGGTKDHPDGIGGYTSAVQLHDANGRVVWKVYPSAPGGGKGGGTSANGAGGSAPGAEKCGYVNAYLETPITTDAQVLCSTIPYYSTISQDGAGKNDGTGGQGYWNGAYTGRTLAGSADSLDGPNGAMGTGGGGGTCTEGPTRLAPNCGNGGSGGPGKAKFTYKKSYPGVGGGGGAAGTLLHVKNIQVHPNDLITVQVGAKGMQGAAGANGKDGGTSYIQLADGTKYQVLGGGGGKTGIAGNPGLNKYSTPGKGGSASGIEAKTKTYLNKDDEYYPKDSSDTKGKDAPANETNMHQAIGGNGGINEKASFAAGDSENRIPCGGFSTTSVIVNKEEYKCESETPSYKPFALSRAINPRSFSLNVIQNYYLGATGGGGGGWLNDFSSDATIDAKSSGADGMGGYVFIYFGDWEQ